MATNDQMVSVGLQRRVDVRSSSTTAGVAGTARVHIYWGIGYTSGIPDDAAVPTTSVAWNTCNITERTTYIANFAEMRLNWVKFRWMPSNLTILGGPTTAVTALAGLATALVIDTTNVDGPDNTTII